MKSRRNLRQILMAAAGLTLLFSLSGCGALFGEPDGLTDVSKGWAVSSGVQFYPEDGKTLEAKRKFFFDDLYKTDETGKIKTAFKERFGDDYPNNLTRCMKHQSVYTEMLKEAKAALDDAKTASQKVAALSDATTLSTDDENKLAAAKTAVLEAAKEVRLVTLKIKNARNDASIASKDAFENANEDNRNDKEIDRDINIKYSARMDELYGDIDNLIDKFDTNATNKKAVLNISKKVLSTSNEGIIIASVASLRYCKNTEFRNKIVRGRIGVIDDQFYMFLRKLNIRNTAWSTGTDAIEIVLNSLAATVGGSTTKSALSAASAGFVSFDGAVNKDVFYDKTLPVIVAQMIVNREKKKKEIETNLTKGLDEYTLSMADEDLKELVYDASIQKSVITLSGLVSTTASDLSSKATTKNIYVQTPDANTYKCELHTSTFEVSGCKKQ